MRYEAPKGTEVSTVLPGGEAITVKKWPVDVVDEPLAAILDGLADDKSNPVHRAKKAKEE